MRLSAMGNVAAEPFVVRGYWGHDQRRLFLSVWRAQLPWGSVGKIAERPQARRVSSRSGCFL